MDFINGIVFPVPLLSLLGLSIFNIFLVVHLFRIYHRSSI